MHVHCYSLPPHLHIAFPVPQDHRILVEAHVWDSVKLKGSQETGREKAS